MVGRAGKKINRTIEVTKDKISQLNRVLCGSACIYIRLKIMTLEAMKDTTKNIIRLRESKNKITGRLIWPNERPEYSNM